METERPLLRNGPFINCHFWSRFDSIFNFYHRNSVTFLHSNQHQWNLNNSLWSYLSLNCNVYYRNRILCNTQHCILKVKKIPEHNFSTSFAEYFPKVSYYLGLIYHFTSLSIPKIFCMYSFQTLQRNITTTSKLRT